MLLLFPGGKLNYIITEAELTEFRLQYTYRQDGSSQRGDLCCILVSDFTGTYFKVFSFSPHPAGS